MRNSPHERSSYGYAQPTVHVSYMHGLFSSRVLLTSRLEFETWLGSVASMKIGKIVNTNQSLYLCSVIFAS